MKCTWEMESVSAWCRGVEDEDSSPVLMGVVVVLDVLDEVGPRLVKEDEGVGLGGGDGEEGLEGDTLGGGDAGLSVGEEKKGEEEEKEAHAKENKG